MSDAWVCPECGLDYGTLHPPFAINAIKSFPRRYTEALAPASPSEDNDAVIRTRPAPAVWSALEYAVHVADSAGEFAVVVQRMYDEDKPVIGFTDPDEDVIASKWNEQAKDDVLARMAGGCAELVKQAERVDANGWTRTAEFPWGERDILIMLQNAVHEGVHHLRDIDKGLAQVRGGTS
ncbi:MAG: hypothetical protein QOF21_1117 [Actinomycetota bacterium]|jgi:S-DNA-T family DNA segregation ATPase FtsK/SpoIIIE